MPRQRFSSDDADPPTVNDAIRNTLRVDAMCNSCDHSQKINLGALAQRGHGENS